MLKFIFWSLLCINGLLLAYGQGLLGNFKGNEHEPARLKNQVNADKLVLVSSASADAAASKAELAKAKAAAEAARPALIACLEVGKFSEAEAKKFEKQLAPLALGEHQSREGAASQEITNHIVYIPPQGSKEGADRKAAELTNLGVTNYFVINDATALKWGISLGVFKSETAAKTLLAALQKQGVNSARILARGPQTSKLTFRFTDIEPAIRVKLDKMLGKYPSAEIAECK